MTIVSTGMKKQPNNCKVLNYQDVGADLVSARCRYFDIFFGRTAILPYILEWKNNRIIAKCWVIKM